MRSSQSTSRFRLMLLGVVLASTGCTAGVFDNDRSSWRPAPERAERIAATDLVARSLVEPVSHETEVEDLIAGGIPLPALDTTTPLLLAEVRRATLEHNLELRVEVISPSIAGASASAEEAKFEAVFLAGYDRNSTNLFTDLEGGDPTTQDSLLTGFKFPLASGGTLNVDTIAAKADAGAAGGAGPWQSSLNFSISQPLLRGAGVRANTASILIANWNKDIADARLKLAAIRLLSDADKAYWTLYAAWRELEVRKSNFDLARAQYERAQRRLDAGDAPELDVIRAQSGIGRSLEAIISADAALRRAQRRIKKIMNRSEYPIGGAAMFEPATKPNPLKLELDGATLAREAVEERMEMLELELQLAVDAATIDLRRNQTLPAFALSYSYSILGNATSVQGAYQDLGDDDAYSVGVSGEVPIGNDAARYNLQAAVLARVQRLATRAARTQAIEGEVFDALDSLRASWQSILAARLETLLAARTLEGEQRQFNVGIRTSTDVLDAASRLADAQSREVRALADYQIALVDIAFATGTLLGHSHLRFDDDAQRFLESD